MECRNVCFILSGRQRHFLHFASKNPANDKVTYQMCQCGKKPAGRVAEIQDKKAVILHKYRINPYNAESAGTKK